ncbi:MAG: hypothetical protein PHY42_01205 [Bacilli bacterium]|nr:hypothetical protein [Bacilli bacterium]
MNPRIAVVLYIVVLIVITFLTFQSLKAFDYEKILRRNQVRELYFLLYVVSFICGFLTAEAITRLLDQIIVFITA